MTSNFSARNRASVRTASGLTWWVRSENNSLSDHLFFYRLWHIRSSIHSSSEIIYGFCHDASENRLWYIHIQLHFTFSYTKAKWYQLFTVNTVNRLLKSFHFQRLMLSENPEIIFLFREFFINSLFFLFWLSNVLKSYNFFEKNLFLPEARSFV